MNICIVLCAVRYVGLDTQPVRSAYQPPASSTFLSEQISHQQPANSTFLSEQTSTSHQPLAPIMIACDSDSCWWWLLLPRCQLEWWFTCDSFLLICPRLILVDDVVVANSCQSLWASYLCLLLVCTITPYFVLCCIPGSGKCGHWVLYNNLSL
jgi:hypothetical protein